MNTKKSNFLPCPFCGNIHIEGFWNDENNYQCGCIICKVYKLGITISKAETAWNTRTPDVNTEMMEALKDGIEVYDEFFEDGENCMFLQRQKDAVKHAQEVEGE